LLSKDLKVGQDIGNNRKLTRNYEKGHLICIGDDLVGVAKGIAQLLLERGVAFQNYGCRKEAIRTRHRKERKKCLDELRQHETPESILAVLLLPSKEIVKTEVDNQECSCAACILSLQEDFRTQKNGLQEVYDEYNRINGTLHFFLMLAKFHPELNTIERLWGRMK